MQNKTIVSMAAGAVVGGALAYFFIKNQQAKKAKAIKEAKSKS